MPDDQSTSPGEAQGLHDLAAGLRREGDMAGAQRAFAELATRFGEASNPEDAFQAGIAEIELSDFAMNSRDDPAALAHAQAAWTIGVRLSTHGIAAGGFLALQSGARHARAHLALGGGSEALGALIETLEAVGAKREELPEALVPVARAVALLLIDNEGRAAVAPLLEELVHFTANVPPPAESEAQEARGDVLREVGNEQAALEAYLAAITARPEGSRDDDLARAALMSQAGASADELGRLVSAAQLYEAALEIREHYLPADDIECLRARYNVAELARYSGGNLEHAADELAAVVAALRDQPGADTDLFLLALKNLAQARLAQHRPEEADRLLHEALRSGVGEARRAAQLLVYLGQAQRELGVRPDVWSELEQLAQEILAKEGPGSRDYLWTLESAASFMPGDRAAAAQHAHELVLDSVGDPQNQPERELVIGAFLNLAAGHWGRGEFTAALDAVRGAVKQQEQVKAETWRIRSALETRGTDPLPIAGIAIELVLRHFADDEGARRFAFRVGTGSKRLQAEVLRRQRELVLEGREELLDLQDLAARLRVEQIALGDATHADELQELDATLASSVPREAIVDSFDGSDVTAVSALLPPGSLLVEYVRCRAFEVVADGPAPIERKVDWYVAFVLPANDPGKFVLVDLGDAPRIDQAVLQLRAAIAPEEAAAAQDWREAARAAAELVWDPIAPMVDIDATVMIAPDGQIGALPFDVLIGPDEHPLLAKHTLVCIGTGRDARLLGSRPNWSSAEPAVYGAPEFGEPWAPFVPLLAAQREANNVGRLLHADPRIGPAATRDSLLSVEDPEILHLATHGYYLPSTDVVGPLGGHFTAIAAKGPLVATGLALADANRRVSGAIHGFAGVVTALDVLGMELFGTDLVVLSACDSGLGILDDGEGLISLARSFALAGARSVLWTLWRVDDWATATLMEGFYKRLLSATPRGRALYRAKRDLLASHPERPDLWGAFVLQGDPSELVRYRFLLSPNAQIGERSVATVEGVTYLDMGQRLTAHFNVPLGDGALRVASMDVTGLGVAAVEDEAGKATRAFRDARYDDAIEHLVAALKALDANSPSARQLAAKLHSRLAVAYGLDGDAERMLDQGLTALAAYEALEDWPLELGQVLDNVAAAEIALGRPGEARAHYERALNIKRAERPGGHPSIDFTVARLRELSEQNGGARRD